MPRWLPIALSGVLLGLSFPPFPFPLLAWVALVPLLLLWMGSSSARRAYLDAYVSLLVTFAVAFHWPLFHTMPETAWMSLPGLLVIPMWMAAPFGLSVIFRDRLGHVGGLLVLIALFLLMELGLRRGPLAFPWTLLGHTQAELFPVNQLAVIGGVPLLTFFVLAANMFVAWLVTGNARELRVGLPLGLVAVALLAWSMITPSPRAGEDARSLRIAIVQPGFSADRWADVHDSARVDTLIELSGSLLGMRTAAMEAGAASDPIPQAALDVDVMLWPETALPPEASVRDRVQHLVAASGVPVLTGAILPSGSDSYYNAALLFADDAEVRVYRKQRLVPFAEHVPLQDRWPWLRRLAVPSGGVAGYAKGSGNQLLEIPTAQLGVVICFESLFDDTIRRYARSGASVIITLTQDGWWGNSFGYRQHVAFNRLRAIESGLPLVQASVSGISGVIAPDGRLSDRIGWMERHARLVTVPAGNPVTLFVRLGDWVTLMALGAMLAAIVAIIYQNSAIRNHA